MTWLEKLLLAIILTMTTAWGIMLSSPTVEEFKPMYIPGAHIVWTPEHGIDFLEYAMGTHQDYVDSPEYINESTGSVEDNRKLISEYRALIDYMEQE